jgi:hypothetical protein
MEQGASTYQTYIDLLDWFFSDCNSIFGVHGLEKFCSQGDAGAGKCRTQTETGIFFRVDEEAELEATPQT